MSYNVNPKGYYGDFGGAYIPEMLLHNIDELKENYIKIMSDDSFQQEFNQLLKDYVGRPSPLYFSKNLLNQFFAIALLPLDFQFAINIYNGTKNK